MLQDPERQNCADQGNNEGRLLAGTYQGLLSEERRPLCTAPVSYVHRCEFPQQSPWIDSLKNRPSRDGTVLTKSRVKETWLSYVLGY